MIEEQCLSAGVVHVDYCLFIYIVDNNLIGEENAKELMKLLGMVNIHTPIWAISEIAIKNPDSFSLKNLLAYVYIFMPIKKCC